MCKIWNDHHNRPSVRILDVEHYIGKWRSSYLKNSNLPTYFEYRGNIRQLSMFPLKFSVNSIVLKITIIVAFLSLTSFIIIVQHLWLCLYCYQYYLFHFGTAAGNGEFFNIS